MASALAGDVLVPTYTPATMSDFAPSERLTEETLSALAAREVAFVVPSEIQRRSGEVADGCADVPDCTTVMWKKFDTARLAVVGSVSWEEGMLAARVRFHGPDDASPIEVISDRFPEEKLPEFAERVAASAADLLEILPPRGAAGVAVAREPDSPQSRPTPEPAPVPVASAPPPEPTLTPEQDELERRSKGMPKRAWKLYRQSGLEYDDWKDKALVRAGSVVIEFHGGAVFGDVDRSYAVRAAAEQIGEDADSIAQIDTYQYESFVTGNTFMLGGAIGYAPVWWLETDVYGGFSLGQKGLSTGWELYKQTSDGELVLACDHPDSDCESSGGVDNETNEYDPATAFLGTVEPRIRLLTVATGPIKPYVLLAASLRFYDGYVVNDLENISYPERQGGLGMGFTGGGGVAFDAPGHFTGFLEVPWTYLITPQPFLNSGNGTIQGVPDRPANSGQVLTFRAGIGFRL
jgi:hypothetical protein